MKARIKYNNEIIDVIQVGTKSHLYDLNNVEFLDNPQDYWTHLEHQAARHIGGNDSNVWAVCNKRAQSYKGKVFVYKDDWLIKEGYFNKEYLA